jgi:ubiquinone/menaquinone biosynthesis C-methylase UbiE
LIESKPATTAQQVEMLADLYSKRAHAYDVLWSPVIRPVGERLLGRLPFADARDVIDVGTGAGALLPVIQAAAPQATVVGVDRSEGMLELAREKHAGPVLLMDAQDLRLPAASFDVAVLAFVLFHLPDPERCLKEVFRVLRPGGSVGTATWANEQWPAVNAIWDQELLAAGAKAIELPAVESRNRCDTIDKMSGLLDAAGFAVREAWIESIEHHWPPDVHFRYQLESTSRARLAALRSDDREHVIQRIRERLVTQTAADYTFRGEVVLVTACLPRLRNSPSGAA